MAELGEDDPLADDDEPRRPGGTLEPDLATETDPRFPSGPWTGFFLQKEVPGKHWMELSLTFRDGLIQGGGRDRVGEFSMRGAYDLATGQATMHKSYVGRHQVEYRGFAEGQGIWGVWQIPPRYKGGFHIWPEGMADPTGSTLRAAADLPAAADEGELVGVGASSAEQ